MEPNTSDSYQPESSSYPYSSDAAANNSQAYPPGQVHYDNSYSDSKSAPSAYYAQDPAATSQPPHYGQQPAAGAPYAGQQQPPPGFVQPQPAYGVQTVPFIGPPVVVLTQEEFVRLEGALQKQHIPRLIKIRVAQIVLCILAGIMSQIPVTFDVGGVGTASVRATAWIIVACIFAAIFFVCNVIMIRRPQGMFYQMPAVPFGEFVTLICLFSAAIQMAQAANAIGSLVSSVSKHGYGVWVAAAIFIWFLFALTCVTLYIQVIIWQAQRRLVIKPGVVVEAPAVVVVS